MRIGGRAIEIGFTSEYFFHIKMCDDVEELGFFLLRRMAVYLGHITSTLKTWYSKFFFTSQPASNHLQ